MVSYENEWFAISTSGLLYQQAVCYINKWFENKWLAMNLVVSDENENFAKSIGIISVI